MERKNHIISILFIILFSLVIYQGKNVNPGLRISIDKNYINSFIKEQLPKLLPQKLNIAEISKTTTHQKFIMNFTNIDISNINLDFLESDIIFNPNNQISVDLKNLNFNLYFEYYFRALLFRTQGHVTFQNNVSFHIEISSSYDDKLNKPILEITEFKITYSNFVLLFGGSVLAYILDLIEGFCDCIVKDQYPKLMTEVFNKIFSLLIEEEATKQLINLNFTQIGLDLSIPQTIEIGKNEINLYLNALFYDPYDPYHLPKTPTNLPAEIDTNNLIEFSLNQGTLNSFLWVLYNQGILNFTIKGDNLPIKLPFQIDTKSFELILPSLYNFYGVNRVIDLSFSTVGIIPKINLYKENQIIEFNLTESLAFMIRLPESSDKAFTIDFSFGLQLNITIKDNYIWIDLIDLRFFNTELVQNKIPNLEIEQFIKEIDDLTILVKGIIHKYLKEHGIPIPNQNVSLNNLNINIIDDNIILSADPIFTNKELYDTLSIFYLKWKEISKRIQSE